MNHWFDHSLIFFIIALILFITCFLTKKRKALFFNIGFFVLALGVVEKYFIIKNAEPNKTVLSPGSVQISPILGYKPTKNFVTHVVSYKGKTLLYDVKYTSDENGLRKTPPITPNDSTKSIVFFGCSFTFGHGLNDNAVMPNIVQEKVNNHYKVYNFANNGYGTQQMLAAIENNIVDTIVKFSPKAFIYVALPDHYYRILGQHCYNKDALKYVLDPKTGEPICAGHFGGNWFKNISNLEIFKLLKPSNEDNNVKLFGAMVLKAKKILLSKYPKSEFHVIFWGYGTPLCLKMEEELRKNNITTHLVSDISPDIIMNLKKYCILYPFEQHPNYRANKLIANYIVNTIIDKNDSFKIPEMEHFEKADSLDNWTIKKYSWAENACEYKASQFTCPNSCLTLTLDINKDKSDKIYKSGDIQSNHSYQYGEFTVRLKNNTVPGAVSTFFLETNWHLEKIDRQVIEIQFVGKDKNQVAFAVRHFRNNKEPIAYVHQHKLKFNSADAFHDYTVVWNKNSISWYVDKTFVCSEQNILITNKMYINLNQWAIFPNDHGEFFTWLGHLDTKQLPSKVSVDYISYKP